MNKKIRTQTTEIFNRIQASLNKPTIITKTTKLVDRRLQSRYHIASK